jgi:hypothetical protein
MTRNSSWAPFVVTVLSVVASVALMEAPPRVGTARYLQWSLDTRVQLREVLGKLSNRDGSLTMGEVERVMPQLQIELRSMQNKQPPWILALSTKASEAERITGFSDARTKVDRVIRMLNALENSTFVKDLHRLKDTAEPEYSLIINDSEQRLAVNIAASDIKTSQDKLIVRLLQEFGGV